jgi:hypothetical protein
MIDLTSNGPATAGTFAVSSWSSTAAEATSILI